MELDIVHQTGGVVCRMAGAFSYCDHLVFGKVLQHIDATARGAVVIDLAGVSLVDSSAVWMLLVARHEAMRRGLGFSLTGASPLVQNLLEEAEAEVEPDPARIELFCLLDDGCDENMRQCRAAGLTPVAAPKNPWISIGCADESRVVRVFRGECAGLIEQIDGQMLLLNSRLLDSARAGGGGVSLSTVRASTMELAHLVGQSLRGQFPRLSDDLDLCLSEAVSNAVIHGNLEIASSLRSSRADFRLFQSTMQQRLADSSYAGRRLEISYLPLGEEFISLCVSDSGQGYNFAEQLAKPVQPGAKHGRGISLIRKMARAVWAENEGRTLVMVFSVR